jgi:hypothetical protein|tara:strand:+ start:4600 stop:4821 length:222 start_codon:yes stop_codon:yes gene_type:complete
MTTTEELQRIENYRNVKQGQKITFEYYGKVYTRKVQGVYVCGWNENQYSFLVNRIGSGTGYINIEPIDIISVK